MKKYLLVLPLLTILLGSYNTSVQAQSIELLGGNTLNGAMNGVVLGGATMALQSSDEFGPVRVGLGAGTLYGAGMGIHDISQTSKGQQFYISGTFNDGTNTSILVLLDTIYGAAGGAVIASSISLIFQKPLTDALQYGTGAGAWVGFGFGLIDAFMFSSGPDFSQQDLAASQHEANGMITYSNASRSLTIGMINPTFVKQKKLTATSHSMSYKASLNALELKINF